MLYTNKKFRKNYQKNLTHIRYKNSLLTIHQATKNRHES